MKNSTVNMPPKQSKNILEQKRKNGRAKILHKDTQIYNNGLKLRSREKNSEIKFLRSF